MDNSDFGRVEGLNSIFDHFSGQLRVIKRMVSDEIV